MGLDRRRVVVVDDDEPIRQLVANVLEDAGYEVRLAADGVAALEAIEAWAPDLVTLDLVMPGLDGWGVIERLRKVANPPPIVVVSGRTDEVPPGVLDRCVAGYVTKPFHVADLLATCRRVLAGTDAPGEPAEVERRREPRRRFIVEATVMTAEGTPLAMGTVTELSIGGVKLDLAAPLRPGSQVRVAFRLPGRGEPLNVAGRIQWRQGFSLGLVLEGVSDDSAQVLKGVVEPE
jgi:DNA-binding response OmpR family regulator